MFVVVLLPFACRVAVVVAVAAAADSTFVDRRPVALRAMSLS